MSRVDDDSYDDPGVDLTPERKTAQTQFTKQDAAAMLDIFGDLKFAEFNNFDGDRVQRFKLTAKATGPSCKAADEALNNEIAVKYFHAQRVEQIDDKTGEIRAWIRIVLFTEAGEAYVFNSNTIARDLLRMIAVFGKNAWNPPIKVIPRKTKSRKNAGGFFSLEPV